MDLETLNFFCVLYTPLPTSPVRMKAIPLKADPYLTVKFGWNIEKSLKFTGQIALFKGGACFNDFLKSIVATGVETFRIYSYMIEPSAQLIRRYGRMRVIQDGKSNLKFIENFKLFWPACVPRLGVSDWCGNFKLLVRTLHTCAYQPCKNEGITFNSRSILNSQIRVKYRENFEIYASNCPIQGGCIFQWFLTEYCSYGRWIFQDTFLPDRAICALN